MKLQNTILSATLMAALFSGAAFAKQPASMPAKTPNRAAQNAVAPEGKLQSIDAKAVTIQEKGKPMRFELAKNVSYSPNRTAIKNGEMVRLNVDKSNRVTAITRA